MYRSRYGFRAGRDRHEPLETIESTINKKIQRLEPQNPTLLVPYDVRNRHIYCIGKTQHGKSTLLYSIISQDIENGAGVCVIDPKPSGDKTNLVETLLQHIPEGRKDDVIYFDAAHPIPIDVMSWETEEERQTLAADLMLTFMQFVAQKDSDRWPGILRYVIHTLLSAKDCSFLDINEFLVDEAFREAVLLRVAQPHLLKYWRTAYKFFPKDAAVPILNRMATFVLVPPLRIMLGRADNALKIEDVIRRRKILLINLSGAGKESGNFIGTLIVSRIQQAVFRPLRTPFHLFADEFQNFQTSAFDTILSEAGGLGLRLTLANQYVEQLDERIRRSVFGNISTFFVLNIGRDDSRHFKHLMPPEVLPETLATQAPFRALYSIAGQQPQFKTIPKPPPPPTVEQLKRAQDIKERTLMDYPPKIEAQPHTEGSGKPDPETIPPDTDQAGDTSAPRGPLRPQEQGPRRRFAQTKPDGERPAYNPKKPPSAR
jgi:hypothetical protein